jgi:hypothetical protein
VPHRVPGLRLGTLLSTTVGTVRNGEITTKAQRDALKAAGYRLEPCDGIPEPEPTANELREMLEADRILGIDRGPDGRTRTERDLDSQLRKALALMAKGTYDPGR